MRENETSWTVCEYSSLRTALKQVVTILSLSQQALVYV